KKFRDDLYYRLFGITIEMPPLRDRDNDVLILAKFFIQEACRENNIKEKILSRAAQKKLLSYSFPGNVRELKSVIELAVVMSNSREIEPEDITFSKDDNDPEFINKELTLREHNLRIIQAYLKKYDNNVKLAAEKLDIGFSTIYRMLRDENIMVKD